MTSEPTTLHDLIEKLRETPEAHLDSYDAYIARGKAADELAEIEARLRALASSMMHDGLFPTGGWGGTGQHKPDCKRCELERVLGNPSGASEKKGERK